MSEQVIIEIRGGEGGDDAKALIREQVGLYVRYCTRRCL